MSDLGWYRGEYENRITDLELRIRVLEQMERNMGGIISSLEERLFRLTWAINEVYGDGSVLQVIIFKYSNTSD